MNPALTVAIRALALRETLPTAFAELSLTDEINVRDYAEERHLTADAAWRRIRSYRRTHARRLRA